MPDHVMPHPDLAGYLLGTLDPGEAVAFEAHLATCPECRQELAALEGIPALLEQATPPVELPPGLRERTFAAVERAAEAEAQAGAGAAAAGGARTARPGARRSLRWLAVAAAALVLLVGGLAAGIRLFRPSPGTTFALAAPDGGAGRGTAHVHRTRAGLVVDLTVEHLPPNDAGHVYECWFVGPNDTLQNQDRISAGTFTVGSDGKASVHMIAAADLARFPRMGVTLEPNDGIPLRRGPKALASK
jgi:anti-sigma factor RsiW